MSFVPVPNPLDVQCRVSSGLLSTQTAVHTFGSTSGVGNVLVDVWSGPTGTYVPPASAIGMQIVSSSANDTAAGTGTRSVRVHYLDDTYAEQTLDITLNGTTPVLTAPTNILRVNGLHSITVGSGGVPAGNISLTSIGGGVTYGYIAAGLNIARQAIYTVPAGKTLYINHWQSGSGAASGSHFTQIILRATSHNGVLLPGVFIVQDQVASLNSHTEVDFAIPLKIAAKADVKLSVVSDAGGANAFVMGAIIGWIE